MTIIKYKHRRLIPFRQELTLFHPWAFKFINKRHKTLVFTLFDLADSSQTSLSCSNAKELQNQRNLNQCNAANLWPTFEYI